MRREGPAVKRPGVLSKVQMLNLVLGVGVFSLLPRNAPLLSENASENEMHTSKTRYVGPDVMQSGFGVNFLFWPGEL